MVNRLTMGCGSLAGHLSRNKHDDFPASPPQVVRPSQESLYKHILDGKAPHLDFGSFTATAQHLISFAVVLVGCILLAMMVLLVRRFGS
jgi:hypothetical protein